jgi:hypothetical protein
MIYFIQAGKAGSIKIGYTECDVSKRLGDLQTACPQALHVLLVIEGTVETEKLLHRRFAGLRRRGEWFHPEPKLLAFIEQMRCNGLPVATGRVPRPRTLVRAKRKGRSGITVWIQVFSGRQNLMLQWHDPETRKRKSRSAGTTDYGTAERMRCDLENELNHKPADADATAA